jgi:hypothetical protein
MELLKYRFYPACDSHDSVATYLHRTNVGLIKSELFPKYMELTTVLVFADVINISGPSRDCREIQKRPYFTAG